MTLLAGNNHMHTHQREGAEIMIKVNVVAPSRFHMALLTARTQLTHMNV